MNNKENRKSIIHICISGLLIAAFIFFSVFFFVRKNIMLGVMSIVFIIFLALGIAYYYWQLKKQAKK